MATANTQSKSRNWIARRWKHALLAIAVIVAGLGWNYGPDLQARAETGAAYGARVACSCRHLGGRSLEDCLKDFEPGMELVSLSEDTQARSVTASVPLLAKQTATFREGQGCLLEKWDR